MSGTILGAKETTIYQLAISAIKVWRPKEEHIAKEISSLSDSNKCYGEK